MFPVVRMDSPTVTLEHRNKVYDFILSKLTYLTKDFVRDNFNWSDLNIKLIIEVFNLYPNQNLYALALNSNSNSNKQPIN
jgi:hypothetical protein